VMSLRRRAGAKPGGRARGAAAALAGMVLTFALMSFSQIFWHSPTWGQATSILAQILGVTASGSTGWSDMPLPFIVPAWICIGIALFVGAGAPGFRRLAPPWLQYGVCLFLLSILSTAGSGRFVYGQF
jgi:alginate O-acetyltransferase complex protein AlgI